MKIPFLKPDIREEDIRRMADSIRTGWLVYGENARMLEKKLAEVVRAPFCVATSSCTASLHMAVILAGVGPGDEVITTPYTWVSTSDVILYQGAKPVFVDVNPDTGMLDPKEVERHITKKTKAVIVVHLFGQMADMKGFGTLAKKHGVRIIEDAAHSLGASRDGIRPGEAGFSACFSFHAAKNITSGQGGALTVKTAALEKRAKAIRRNGVLGRDKDRHKYELGYKYDGTDFQAALLLGQIDRLKRTHAARERIWTRYEKAFANISGVTFQKKMPGVVHAGHMFVLWVDPRKRDAIRAKLAKKGVSTSVHWDPVHLEPYYVERFRYKRGDFPVAERLGFGSISLPTYPSLSRAEQEYVIKAVHAAL